MTKPLPRPAGTPRTGPRRHSSRIAAALVAGAALMHLSSASASLAADDFDAHFAAFATPAEPAIPAQAVDLDDLVTGADAAPALADAAAPAEEASPIEQLLGSGVASYYGNELAGRRTASGERFDPRGLTAAHRTLPFGSKVRVTNPANGRSVVVRINDRGPFARGRLIDLSRSAAAEIGLVARGHGTVEIALLGG